MTTHNVDIQRTDTCWTASIHLLGLAIDIDHPDEADPAIRQALAAHGLDTGAVLHIEHDTNDPGRDR